MLRIPFYPMRIESFEKPGPEVPVVVGRTAVEGSGEESHWFNGLRDRRCRCLNGRIGVTIIEANLSYVHTLLTRSFQSSFPGIPHVVVTKTHTALIIILEEHKGHSENNTET